MLTLTKAADFSASLACLRRQPATHGVPMRNLRVTEASGVVTIFGLSSQPVALQLCDRFGKQGVKTTIGMLPGVAGYQVSVYQLGIDEVKAALGKMGVKSQSD
jgi:hypothetical protein